MTTIAAVDFSPVTARVLDVAAKLARGPKDTIVLVHAVVPPVTTRSAPLLSSRELLETLETDADRLLKQASKRLQRKAASVETVKLLGAPAPALAECARSRHADWIVIGSHGHGAAYELLVGSTTRAVLCNAPCPVVVVPAAEPRKPMSNSWRPMSNKRAVQAE